MVGVMIGTRIPGPVLASQCPAIARSKTISPRHILRKLKD